MDIIVIGAGVAGLSAARTLADAGKKVVIIEARHRLGGRLYTRHDLADSPVELGGELIHGDHAATWELIREHNITTVKLQGDGSGGQSSFRNLNLEALPTPSPDETVTEYLQRTDLQTPTELAYLDIDEEPLRRTGARFLMQWYSGALQREGELYGDNDYRIPGGYDQIVHTLAKDIPVHLGAQVERIARTKAGVTITYWQDGALHTITTPQAVITLPLGVLKHGGVQFVPALPADKQQAILTLSTVDIAKLAYVFDEQILPDDTSVITDASTIPGMWWHNSPGATGKQSIIIGWAAGDAARSLLEMEYAAALQHGLEALQRHSLSPKATPVAALMHNWAADPYTRGAYSFSPPGCPVDAFDVLAQQTDNVLFWAGEATWAQDPSTVHGAYESGRRAAREIIGS